MAETTSDQRTGSTEEPVLETENLRKTFGELVAVDDVSLRIEPGELRSIIGPNGAGKTTLFNLIAGVLAPTGGRISFAGDEVTDLPIETRAQRGMGRSFQGNELFFEQTVYENVRVAAQTAELGEFKLDLLSRADEFMESTVTDVLERVHLTSERDTLAKNLSHGDQRRLGIAIALATDPDLLLLDEPTSGMGPEATLETANLIRDLRDEMEFTVVLIEHDMSVVMEISDRISVLHNGSHIAMGKPEEVRENDAVQEAYLGGMKEEELDR